MTKAKDTYAEKKEERLARAAIALRENLRRRKEQARARERPGEQANKPDSVK